ncbi:winged helix-turn-helix transcriptional regulator [Hydrogenophaga taeniospiralis]|jgi:DNA-binding HxlR family transcriptional regulator|uniref:winged helix-turn-helix transcriptional regulator n=1 Tax=Hydrogenophaga taeniospiralis TaxID=65656 RepID=UPI00082E350B|nr:helix-turn-helix domain-containing protein [Hydrogenophaga taeniospiralis]
MGLHKPKAPLSELCPIRDVLDRLGDRWTVLVLHELALGTLRFGELRKRIEDISPRMLSQTLRQLEEDGLVGREVFASVPPRVDYTLTGLGESFFQSIQTMLQWAVQNQEAVHAARRAYVAPKAIAAK